MLPDRSQCDSRRKGPFSAVAHSCRTDSTRRLSPAKSRIIRDFCLRCMRPRLVRLASSRDTASRRVPTFRTLLSSPPAAVDLQRPPRLGVRSNVSHERVLGQTVPPSAAAYLPRRLLGSRRSPAWPPESCRPALPCRCSRLPVPASKRVRYWRPFCRPIPRRVKRSKSLGCPWPRKQTRFKQDAGTGPAGPPGAALRSWRRRLAPCKLCGGAHDPWVRRDRGPGSPPPPGVPACTAKRACRRRPAGAAWGACWPAGRAHAWTGGATAGTGHPQSVGCAHLELHASLRAPRAALAPPTAWRATAAPEAQPPAMALVQIVVRSRPAAHDTICHRPEALHAWQFGRCWDMPPAPPAACWSRRRRVHQSTGDGSAPPAVRRQTTTCTAAAAKNGVQLRGPMPVPRAGVGPERGDGCACFEVRWLKELEEAEHT